LIKKRLLYINAESDKKLFQREPYENLTTNPLAPFIEGEFVRNFSALPRSAALTGKDQFVIPN